MKLTRLEGPMPKDTQPLLLRISLKPLKNKTLFKNHSDPRHLIMAHLSTTRVMTPKALCTGTFAPHVFRIWVEL